MEVLQMIVELIWDWSRTVFGTIFVACVLMSLALLIIELVLYRKKSARQEAAETAGAQTGKNTVRIALITGASSGLGKTFALQIDQGEADIDEIWLIARRRERLKEAAAELSLPARVIPMDVTEEESIRRLEKLLEGGEYCEGMEPGNPAAEAVPVSGSHPRTIQVGIFANCAGYAKIGNYEKISRFDSANMIDLNCRAAVNTTLAVLPHMRAGDRILEICSTAAFQPIQHMNLYAASKAFLYSYTRALRMELLPRGVVVTAVCPWWVKDTEFISVASHNEANPDVKSAVRSFPLATKEEQVVRRALRASRMRLAVSTPGIMCFLHRLLGKVIPKKWLLYCWELFRRIG